ncbi:MAG TPA: excinuclease ABC subunit UvrC [Oligoflexia bacterium]|nr:excinuclease ABC subunit UvrC [Oligoflexia bacterium]
MKKSVVDLIKRAPYLPGVYIMKDSTGKILYIGKANKLIDRLKSYVNAYSDERPSVKIFIPKVSHIDWLVTETEKEALLLESSLIKSHRPKYNIDLKDDKSYVSLKMSGHHFPRLYITRKIKKGDGEYFGPYSSAKSVRETLKEVQKIFKIRDCTDYFFKQRKRPCLRYQIKRCSAPCVSYINDSDYLKDVIDAKKFLKGNKDSLINHLSEKMNQASKAFEYEQAAIYRDKLSAIEKTLKPQAIDHKHPHKNIDFIAVFGDETASVVKVISMRQGRISNTLDFLYEESIQFYEEILGAFFGSYYLSDNNDYEQYPQKVFIERSVADQDVYASAMSDLKGSKVSVQVPQKGQMNQLLEMTKKNAKIIFLEKKRKSQSNVEVLQEIERKFRLKNYPKKIEGYDISTFHGSASIGSKVVFVDGEADKSQYRFYNVKESQYSNDFAMMFEVFKRRLSKLDGESDPDLILIDGGKGQMSQALKIMNDLGIDHIDVIAIAKEKEWKTSQGKNNAPERIFIPNQKNPIILKPGSKMANLLQSIRDEAHRFGLKNHRKKRNKTTLKSDLSKIPTIGPKKQKLLLQHFKSLKNIQNADLDALMQVESLGSKAAKMVYDFFNANNQSDKS